jgi:hypothetical protein
MIAVAVIGLMIGCGVWLKQRRDYFLSLAQSHQNEVASSSARGTALKSRFVSTSGMSNEGIMQLYRDYDRMMDRAEHHAAMTRKYRHAARYPWLIVEPDPPEPD